MLWFSLTLISHIGLALSDNPGFLKLRKIRAAQAIATTVIESVVLMLCITFGAFSDCSVAKPSVSKCRNSHVEFS